MLFVFLRGNLRVLRGKNGLSVFAFPLLSSPVLPVLISTLRRNGIREAAKEQFDNGLLAVSRVS